jgi:hypothetical protein
MQQPVRIREFDITKAVRHLGFFRVGRIILIILLATAIWWTIGVLYVVVFHSGGINFLSLAIMLVGLAGLDSLFHYRSLPFRGRYAFDVLIFIASICLSGYIFIAMIKLSDELKWGSLRLLPDREAMEHTLTQTGMYYFFASLGLIVALVSLLRIGNDKTDVERRVRAIDVTQTAHVVRAAQPKPEFKGRPINSRKALIYLAIAIGIYLAFNLLSNSLGGVFGRFFSVFLSYCAIGVNLAFAAMLLRARQYLQTSSDSLLDHDHRKPILYLRSFVDDTPAQVGLLTHPWGGLDRLIDFSRG